MDTNTQLEGILFSGENVLVSVFDELTTFNEQGKVLNSRVKEYSREMGRPTNISLDSFLFGEVFNSDAVLAVRRYQFENERDKKKCTSLKVACLAAKLRDRSSFLPIEKRIAEYNSLVCMDFHDPERLDWIKETLATLPYVYYAGISSGKTGVFAIIPIVCRDWHEHIHYFDMLVRITRARGLHPSRRGRNVTDLRYQSIDENPYINRMCTRFSLARAVEDPQLFQ